MPADHLFLVEDDPTTREVLTLLLEADGWQVRSADSGEAALEVLRLAHEKQDTTQPEIILCDLHLPGVHGAALAELLRAAVPTATLVAISASGGGAPVSGYDASLQKPFQPSELRALLATMGTEPATPSSVEALQDVPVIRPETFLQLEQQMGGRARDLYAFALADAGDRVRRMEGALRNGDAAVYKAEAHQLKGSAGMIGAERLAHIASEAENCTELTTSLQHAKLHQMRLACDEIRRMLETLFPI